MGSNYRPKVFAVDNDKKAERDKSIETETLNVDSDVQVTTSCPKIKSLPIIDQKR